MSLYYLMELVSNVWKYFGRFVGNTPFAPVQTTEPISAIIIGINNYASSNVNPLEGPVSDAHAVKEYLIDELGFLESRIRLLCDARATRRNIIQEFENLVDHEHPDNGSPILIFYAGHGSEAKAPKNWGDDGSKIQMLLPYDFRTIVDGQEIEGIPDRTIGALLSQIAKKWGNNITVIFDSCHSGSNTRGDVDSSFTARFTEISDSHVVPSDLDRKIWGSWDGAQVGTRGAARAPGLLYRDQSSHIFLAACKKEEVAYETRGAIQHGQVNGVFTAALLNRLYRVRGQNISYADLFRLLPSLPRQTPQCLGANRNRVLFSTKVQERVLFEVTKVGDSYVIDAGTARGIDIGDEFTVYDDYYLSQGSAPLGTLVVLEARRFESIMALRPGTSRFKLDKPAIALRANVGPKQDLRVHVADTEQLKSTFEVLVEMQDEQPHRPRILAAEKQNAMLGIDMDGEKVVFDVLDERVTKFHPLRIPSSVQPDVGKLHSILDAAAHFYWHLNRIGESHNLQDMVRLEFTEVKQVKDECDEYLRPVIKPVGENLNKNGVIELVEMDTVMHGINIVNNSTVPLYASLFYFDVSNLSITSFSQPPFARQNKVDPPLLPKGSITLGYGPGGGTPNIYKLNEGQRVDVGFLKLFLSTEYVDLSDIPQMTPFTTEQKRLTESAEKLIEPVSLWDTILVTLVIRKK